MKKNVDTFQGINNMYFPDWLEEERKRRKRKREKGEEGKVEKEEEEEEKRGKEMRKIIFNCL